MHSMLSPQPSSPTIAPLALVVVALEPSVIVLPIRRWALLNLVLRVEVGSVVARSVTTLVALVAVAAAAVALLARAVVVPVAVAGLKTCAASVMRTSLGAPDPMPAQEAGTLPPDVKPPLTWAEDIAARGCEWAHDRYTSADGAPRYEALAADGEEEGEVPAHIICKFNQPSARFGATAKGGRWQKAQSHHKPHDKQPPALSHRGASSTTTKTNDACGSVAHIHRRR